ncbi:hypothetical protein CRG98_013747 [Punica granatum]|uniref:Zinc finger, CCHC-type n=1 Tax=Punica granatum TaxID=22663 RepID=A0A2I0KCL2_PUNGR|nr:hypothetical protein CRG98_013747 [Punica granatum]
MIGYVETLGRLEFPLSQELATDLILLSLLGSYNQFFMNYNMNEYNKLFPKLLSMLKTVEQNINKGMPVLMVQMTKKKGKDKKKGKKAKGASKYDFSVLKPKAMVAKDDYCFHSGNTSHWKQNCKVCQEELRKTKGRPKEQ